MANCWHRMKYEKVNWCFQTWILFIFILLFLKVNKYNIILTNQNFHRLRKMFCIKYSLVSIAIGMASLLSHKLPQISTLFNYWIILITANTAAISNPTIHIIIRWFAGSMGQMTRRPSVCHSKYFFFIISYWVRALKTLYFHFCNFIKKK